MYIFLFFWISVLFKLHLRFKGIWNGIQWRSLESSCRRNLGTQQTHICSFRKTWGYVVSEIDTPIDRFQAWIESDLCLRVDGWSLAVVVQILLIPATTFLSPLKSRIWRTGKCFSFADLSSQIYLSSVACRRFLLMRIPDLGWELSPVLIPPPDSSSASTPPARQMSTLLRCGLRRPALRLSFFRRDQCWLVSWTWCSSPSPSPLAWVSTLSDLTRWSSHSTLGDLSRLESSVGSSWWNWDLAIDITLIWFQECILPSLLYFSTFTLNIHTKGYNSECLICFYHTNGNLPLYFLHVHKWKWVISNRFQDVCPMLWFGVIILVVKYYKLTSIFLCITLSLILLVKDYCIPTPDSKHRKRLLWFDLVALFGVTSSWNCYALPSPWFFQINKLLLHSQVFTLVFLGFNSWFLNWYNYTLLLIVVSYSGTNLHPYLKPLVQFIIALLNFKWIVHSAAQFILRTTTLNSSRSYHRMLMIFYIKVSHDLSSNAFKYFIPHLSTFEFTEVVEGVIQFYYTLHVISLPHFYFSHNSPLLLQKEHIMYAVFFRFRALGILILKLSLQSTAMRFFVNPFGLLFCFNYKNPVITSLFVIRILDSFFFSGQSLHKSLFVIHWCPLLLRNSYSSLLCGNVLISIFRITKQWLHGLLLFQQPFVMELGLFKHGSGRLGLLSRPFVWLNDY